MGIAMDIRIGGGTLLHGATRTTHRRSCVLLPGADVRGGGFYVVPVSMATACRMEIANKDWGPRTIRSEYLQSVHSRRGKFIPS